MVAQTLKWYFINHNATLEGLICYPYVLDVLVVWNSIQLGYHQQDTAVPSYNPFH